MLKDNIIFITCLLNEYLYIQQIEQEMEHIREAHRMLEASTVRREGLEKTLRVKYEQEIRRIKEENINLKGGHF